MLLVGFAAMPDYDYLNDVICVIHGIDYSIIANANAPATLRADKLTATGRAWVNG